MDSDVSHKGSPTIWDIIKGEFFGNRRVDIMIIINGTYSRNMMCIGQFTDKIWCYHDEMWNHQTCGIQPSHNGDLVGYIMEYIYIYIIIYIYKYIMITNNMMWYGCVQQKCGISQVVPSMMVLKIRSVQGILYLLRFISYRHYSFI